MSVLGFRKAREISAEYTVAKGPNRNNPNQYPTMRTADCATMLNTEHCFQFQNGENKARISW